MNGNILVTGAAGYIGSVVTERLLAEGYRVIALDNLEQGHRQALDSSIQFIKCDLAETGMLDDIFSGNSITAVMHFAAHSIVSHSMADPGKYFQNNVVCGMNLLSSMVKHRVTKIVFSSSASVYGMPDSVPVTENAVLSPVNPYGESKLILEKILKWYKIAYGIDSISLRYFNASGATQRCGECHEPETHLIPNMLKAAQGKSENIRIFGTDYNTKDGTCIRDYVHVLDIAAAHLQALKRIDGAGFRSYNLGSATGYSVLEVFNAAKKVTGVNILPVFGPRRSGDPPVLVASSELAGKELGWAPCHSDLETIVNSAWQWHCRFPDGYSDRESIAASKTFSGR